MHCVRIVSVSVLSVLSVVKKLNAKQPLRHSAKFFATVSPSRYC